ncbi:hypothetical protein [Croceimicrobium sp.]|uniref:hypothetical protein n=1 Tax=Croceimicrobium sp. TaxID=2828340 RepID=UPI003BAB2438
MAAFAAIALTSCEDDSTDTNNNGGSGSTEVVPVSGTITSDVTWSKDKIYRLDGRVLVAGNATLTIDAGTIIKASPGSGAFASALIVTRDGMINAQGTATEPIIFTTLADDIKPGQIASPNMDPTNNGLWGGVIILGEAKISASNDNGDDVSELQIEGIPTSVDAIYGGSNDADNSGTFSYVSIRHGGANIGDGNEINGLTMGGVGSGTTIDHIEIVANQDDGIEWFGGAVSLNNVLIWNCGDDGLDTDQDWIGTCEDFIIVSPDGSAFELDGPEGSLNRGTHQFNNGTVYAGSAISDLVDWDDNTNAGVSNVYFYGWSTGYMDGISSFAGDGTGNNANWEYTLTSGGMPVDSVFKGADMSILSEVAKNANTVGHTGSFGYTWASQSGSLSAIGL